MVWITLFPNWAILEIYFGFWLYIHAYTTTHIHLYVYNVMAGNISSSRFYISKSVLRKKKRSYWKDMNWCAYAEFLLQKSTCYWRCLWSFRMVSFCAIGEQFSSGPPVTLTVGIWLVWTLAPVWLGKGFLVTAEAEVINQGELLHSS